jgi:hypothetical protein
MIKKYLILAIVLFLNCSCINRDKKNLERIPSYGKFCKPNLNNHKTNIIPIDKTDLAYKNLAKCYKINNKNDLQCNEIFLNEPQSFSAKNQDEKYIHQSLIKNFKI